MRIKDMLSADFALIVAPLVVGTVAYSVLVVGSYASKKVLKKAKRILKDE